VSLLRLAWIGVRRRALSSALTAIYVGLGAALALLVVAVRGSTERSYADAAQGYDLVLAPQNGSGLQAALSTLFFVGESTSTLPWSAYESAQKDPRVKAAVPYAMGDVYRGHRVVGTSLEHFQVLTDSQKRPLGEGLTGRLFAPSAFEAVMGSLAARATGHGLGDELRVSHGLQGATHEHLEVWKIVGILRPTGTPQDRAIFIPVESFYDIEAHKETAQGKEHELSAVGLRVHGGPLKRLELYGELRKAGSSVQPVMPAYEIARLLENVIAPLDTAFRWVAGLVLLVGGLGILVGLYNTLQGRRREIAVLRALGARPWHVFAVILLEALLLCLLGGLLGLLIGHGTLVILAPRALAEYGVRIEADLGLLDLQLLGGLLALGAVAGLVPAWRGLRTPVAQNLSPVEG
jgi:putative ABC transport system permease protein